MLTLKKVDNLFLFYLFIFKAFIFLKILFIDFEREGKGKKERERNTNVWLPLIRPLLGTRSATQACALTGN